MDLRQIATPATEPVTLAEARVHLRVDGTDEDALIAGWITAARGEVEDATGRALLPQDWELRLPAFPSYGCSIELPRAPLIAILSVVTVAADGAETTLDAAAYQAEAPSGPTAQPARLWPAAGAGWPTTASGVRGAVRVRYRAGYPSLSLVPGPLKSATLLALGDLYANREQASAGPISDNPAFARLIAPYRLWSV